MSDGVRSRTIFERREYIVVLFVVRVLGILAVLVGCFGGVGGPGTHGRGLIEAVAVVVFTAGWIGWMAFGRAPRALKCSVLGMAFAGAVYAGIDLSSAAIAVPAVAAMAAGSTGDLAFTVIATGLAILTLAVSALITGGSLALTVVYAVVILTGLGVGFARLGSVQRADQAEALLEQTRLTREAQAQAAALAERTRIAREIHDILAHSLGALTLQIEAAHARLTAPGAPSQDPVVAKALVNLERAGSLARAGLADTRRAVHALRDDPGLLTDLLAELCRAAAENGREGAVKLRSNGEPRRLPSDATAAFFRAAQEALTNAAKHAPGRDVEFDLEFGAREVVLTAVNTLSEADRDRPLAASGAGYGLTGLRERAELAGGTMTAQVSAGAFRVRVAIPG